MTPDGLATPAPLTTANENASFRDYLELTKPRLSMLSVITAVVGYFVSNPTWDLPIFLLTLLGTSLAAAGVAALNQWMEADTDAMMKRTAQRPIPSGKVQTGSAFVLGWALCAAGLAVLFGFVNGPSAFFALLTIISYLAFYTPAKRWSRWSTEIGAVAGAFPPLIGWGAAGARDPFLGAVLFGMLFFWQVPHFMAIAWTYRRDYEAVHFPMLAVRDSSGSKVALWSFINSLALLAVTISPCFASRSGKVYLGLSLLLGLWFVYRAALFLREENREKNARSLFFASIIWLPLQLIAFVADRTLSLP